MRESQYAQTDVKRAVALCPAKAKLKDMGVTACPLLDDGSCVHPIQNFNVGIAGIYGQEYGYRDKNCDIMSGYDTHS